MAGGLAKDVVLDDIHVQGFGTNGGVECREGGVSVFLSELRKHFIREFQLPVLETPVKEFTAVYGTVLFLKRQRLLHLGAGLGTNHPAQPVLVGTLVFGGLDFHHVSGLQLFPDGNSLAVNLGANAVGTYVCMYAEGKIQHGSACGKDSEFSGGSEHEYLLGRRLRQFLGVFVRVLQGITHGCKPFVKGFLAFYSLISPVGGKAIFGHVVHTVGADLDLHICSFTVLDRNVKALVAVWLGGCNPVPEALGVGLIFLCHKRVHSPAEVFLQFVVFGVALYDEADCKYVVDALKRHFLLLHLLPD